QQPAWVNAGYQEYAKRLPAECTLDLITLPMIKRAKNFPIHQIKVEESQRLLMAVPKNCHLIALDEKGVLWDTLTLAQQLTRWQHQGQHVALLIGGADGLAESAKQAAKQLWSLSPLTLPHGMVRIIV